jgi:four helix bundle protein
MKKAFENLIAFQKAYRLSMEIFKTSKHFPKEETYSLTDQIRRSSRSVSVNIAEAYRKRRYEKHFISKMTDCDVENSETYVWLMYALDCQYITQDQFSILISLNNEVGKLT